MLQECIDKFVWTDDCTATIADAEACVTAALADPCREETIDGPRCAWVVDCYADE